MTTTTFSDVAIKPAGAGLWSVYYKGVLVVHQESFTVAGNLADALRHPEVWEPTEIQDLADSIRRWYGPPDASEAPSQ